MAVLCRTGDDCRSVADELEALGLRACVSRKGLLDQEEIRLCLRACRVAADDGAVRLDLAELYHLFHPGGDWFEAASARKLEEGISCWQALRALHERAWVLTPSEMLDEVMDVADAFRLVSSWSRGQERRANLEALRVLAKEYESAMHSRRDPVDDVRLVRLAGGSGAGHGFRRGERGAGMDASRLPRDCSDR